MINGLIKRATCLASILRKRFLSGNNPGKTIWKIDQISNNLFSIGVPERAKQFLTLNWRK